MRRYVLGDAQSEDGVINDKGMMGDIFYQHTVVGGVVYFKNDIYGGRTSLFLTSLRCSQNIGHINTFILKHAFY